MTEAEIKERFAVTDALDRLITVTLLFKRLGITMQQTTKQQLPKSALMAYAPALDKILYSAHLSDIKVTSKVIDKLTFALLHELGHAIQDRTNFYPDVKKIQAVQYDSREDMQRALDSIELIEAKYLHIEHDADAFAIDMCLRLGMPNVMDHCGYL